MYPTDNEILEQIIAGKRGMFAHLIDRYKDQAMTLAMRMLKNREDAEEASQDAFIRAYNAIEKFERKSKFSTWLYRIVFNVCATRLRKKNIDISMLHNEGNADNPEELFPSVAPLIEYEHKELINFIKLSIEELPEKYGMMLSLFYFQELSYDEICEVTQLPLGTVKTQLFRARSLLLKHLSFKYEIESI